MIRLLTFVALFTVGSAIKSNCDANKFVLCQNQFADALGIDRSYNWLNPSALSDQIQQIYAHGSIDNPQQKGIISVCNGYAVFLDCLNDNAFTASECFDPLFLLSADSKPDQAYAYAFLMNMVQYQCGAGFYPAVDNWSCMQQVYTGKSDQLNKCVNTFANEITNDPDNSCKYVQEGMNCWSKVTRGCSDELQYYACESFRQYTMPRYAYCNEVCPV